MIGIGSDHGGFFLKESIKDHLIKRGIPFEDIGIHDTNSVDYPDIAAKLCPKVIDKTYEFGILICGTGIGISIAANKFCGIRCALCCDPYSARMTKEHNSANVIALGGRILGPDLAIAIVDSYIDARFQGGRHQNRIDKITNLEK